MFHTENASTLFRGSTMATTLMDQYMKMTGTSFVHTAVEGVITKIVEMKQSCEVMPHYFFNQIYCRF